MWTDHVGAIAGILVGLVALTVGAELLVRAASRLAAAARISPLVIGLTVVAFGTSLPELAVSFQAAVAGEADVALGNVVGSNIFNILFILGVSALILPLVVDSRLIRWDVPLMIVASVAVYVGGYDGLISRAEGVALLTGLLAYVVWTIRSSRREHQAVVDEFQRECPRVTPRTLQCVWDLMLIAVSLGLLTWGSNWLVHGSVTVARALGVSELIVGLTIVAAGTSLPEVATSVTAALRGEREIAVGNVVGSNLFNITCVLGLSAVAAGQGVSVSPVAIRFDIPVMIVAALACLPIFLTGHVIARWEGGLFLLYYGIYLVYLVMSAVHSPALQSFTNVMVIFVLPLTAITLGVTVMRHWRSAERVD